MLNSLLIEKLKFNIIMFWKRSRFVQFILFVFPCLLFGIGIVINLYYFPIIIIPKINLSLIIPCLSLTISLIVMYFTVLSKSGEYYKNILEGNIFHKLTEANLLLDLIVMILGIIFSLQILFLSKVDNFIIGVAIGFFVVYLILKLIRISCLIDLNYYVKDLMKSFYDGFYHKIKSKRKEEYNQFFYSNLLKCCSSFLASN